MFQALSLTCIEYPVLTAIAYGYLFPVYKDEDSFYARFEQLFGANNGAQLLHLARELRTVAPNKPMPVLSRLIKEILNARLTAYRQANESLSEISAFCAMTNILVIENESEAVLKKEHDANPEQVCVYLLRTEEGFSPLIDTSLFSSAQREQFSAIVFKPAPDESLALEGFLQNKVKQFSRHLDIWARPGSSLNNLATETTILASPNASGMHQQLYDLTPRVQHCEQSINAITLDAVQMSFDDLACDDLNRWSDVAPKAGAAGLVAGLAAGGMIELLLEVNFGFLIGSLLWVEALPLALVATLVGVGLGLSGGGLMPSLIVKPSRMLKNIWMNKIMTVQRHC